MKMSETQPGMVAKQYGGNTRPVINHMERTDLPGARQKIQKWDMIPDECFVQRMAGEFVKQTSNELFNNKKIVLFSLPGAFTPTCSTKQLPYMKKCMIDLRRRVLTKCIVTPNDGFVMNAWAKDLGIEKVKLLADGNGDFTDSMGMLCTKRNKGFANRSWRYSLYAVNGIVQEAFVEPGFNHKGEDDDPYTCTDPETMIQFIEAEGR